MSEVYQLVVGTKEVPLRGCLLRGGDDSPVHFTYSFWVVRHDAGVLLVDTGFGPEVAARRGISFGRGCAEALRGLGVAPGEVTDVVLTHLHFDHAGGLDALPAARVHLQAADLAFYTGPYMRFGLCSSAVEAADVAAVRRLAGAGRLVRLDGDGEIRPGVRVLRVGGHTPGTQLVEVDGDGGRVVLAADAAHLYANLERRVPFPVLHDVPSSCEAFERLDELAAAGADVVPGHDGAVMSRYPRVPGPAGEYAVRLA